ncbi:MAG: MarR family transcriptional regulator [Pseudomonadota bacterium]|jgi:DNA-binding MarR family transcriptional regulator|nr:MarR family transcriptional regulator [Pseudomonadota bacterium]
MPQHKDLLTAIRQITRAIDLNSKRLAKMTGLTAPQLLVLQTLAGEGPSKPSEIARQVHLSQATITSIVDRLEAAGLVERQKNETDRRAIDIVITQTGLTRLAEAPEALQEGFLKRFDSLELWEQSLLISSVQRLAAMMNAGSLDAAPILEVGDLQKES